MPLKTMKNRRQVTFYANDDIVQLFRRKYPNCISAYLRRCLIAANSSSDVFQKIFFEIEDNFTEVN